MSKLKLNKKTREHVEMDYEREGGDRSFAEHYGAMVREYLPKMLANRGPYDPIRTDEQEVAACLAHLADGPFMLSRGYAKRLIDDVPEELARSASLFSRLEVWGGISFEEGDHHYKAQRLLPAMAAGDFFVVERYAAELPHHANDGYVEHRMMHNGIVAAFLRNDDLLAKACADFKPPKSTPKWMCFIADVFRGLHQRDADAVAVALSEVLKSSRRIDKFDVHKIISLETHGLYELCRRFDPTLVAGFDTCQSLPWDEGLYDWVRNHTHEPPCYDVSEISPLLQQWLDEIPFKADGHRYWPGGVREVYPQEEVVETPAPPIAFRESWRVVLTKHASEEIDKQYSLVDSLFENEDRVSNSSATIGSEEKLPAGRYVPPREPHVLGFSRTGEPWFLLSGERINEEWVRKNGKRKRVQTLSVGYDSERLKTHFRLYDGGKIAIDFEATGPPEQPAKKRRIKSIESLEGVVPDDATPAETIAALLDHAEARQMLVRLVTEDRYQRLCWQNGDALAEAKIDETFRVSFYALTEGENPASDRLQNAIYDCDPAAVTQAIADGANLEWLPNSNASPLEKAIGYNRDGWRECVRALVEGGAQVDGFLGDTPPIIYAFSWVRHGAERLGQLNAIDAIDCLLELGADVNARDTGNHGEGRTPLHHAADKHATLIAAHLVAAGADVDAVDDHGRTAAQIAERRAEDYHGEAGEEAGRIAKMLSGWAAGRLDKDGLRAFFQSELESAEARRKAELTQSNAKVIALQGATEISIRPLPDFGEADYAKPLVADLEAGGFVKIGYFQLDAAMRLRVVAFHHPERRVYGLVIIIARAALVDIMRIHNDDSATNVANAEFSNDYSEYAESHEDLPIRYHVVEGGSVAELLAKLDAIPPHESGVALVKPDEIEDRLRRHHQVDATGQARVAKRILGS